MSPYRKHLFIALAVGVILALVTKATYDLFNGYAIIPALVVRGYSLLSVLLNELVQFAALGIPAYIVGTVLRARLPAAPRQVVFACAVPWIVLTLYGVASSLVRFGWPPLHESVLYTLVAALAPILVVLSVPAGLWLAVAQKRRSVAVAP